MCRTVHTAPRQRVTLIVHWVLVQILSVSVSVSVNVPLILFEVQDTSRITVNDRN